MYIYTLYLYVYALNLYIHTFAQLFFINGAPMEVGSACVFKLNDMSYAVYIYIYIRILYYYINIHIYKYTCIQTYKCTYIQVYKYLYYTSAVCTRPDIAKAFINNWVSRYGVPNRILSDRGTNFIAAFNESMQQLLRGSSPPHITHKETGPARHIISN